MIDSDCAARCGTVLVVDDETDVREMLSDVLSASGFQVTSAENGRVALNVMRFVRPDLLLLDVMMPIMDGREVIAALPRLFAAPEEAPRVVVMSAGDKLCAFREQNSVADVLRKPFDLDELVRTLRGLLRAGMNDHRATA